MSLLFVSRALVIGLDTGPAGRRQTRNGVRNGWKARPRECCYFGSELWVGADGGIFHEASKCLGAGEDAIKGSRRAECPG